MKIGKNVFYWHGSRDGWLSNRIGDEKRMNGEKKQNERIHMEGIFIYRSTNINDVQTKDTLR